MARVVTAADAAALEARAREGFRARFGREAARCATAPGRANLIGEHTDYNDGFVLPFAIARRTAVAVAPRHDRRVHVASASLEGVVEFDLDAPGPADAGRGQPRSEDRERGQPRWREDEPRWGAYIRGVVAECLSPEVDLDPGGFDAWIDSDVPVGSGLSSSAALEVALTGAIEGLAGRTIDAADKAALCRRAEHAHAGVPCGIMDQMASALAEDDTLLLLDCRDLSWERVPLPAGAVQVVVVDSLLPHDLGQGEFARRVEQCRSAARLLGVASLRDAGREQAASLADPVLRARALHVVDENARVLAAVRAIRTNDWPSLGALMDASHDSLRRLFEVSRPEMDELVEELRRAGALGARMTGGGFGGCAVALLPAGASLPELATCAARRSDG